MTRALSTRRSKLIVGVTAITVAATAVLVVLTAGPATAKEFATLHVLAGTVEVQKGAASEFEPGAEGQNLRERDTVRTGPDGRAEIEYFDGSVTRLDFDTTFRLKTLESDPDEPESKVIVGEQQDGQTFNRVVALTGSESRFETETPTATASVRGTEYVVKLLPDGSTEYWVIEGAISLTTPDGEELLVGAGEGVVVFEDGTIGAKFPLTDEQLNDAFVDFNQCVLDGVEECVEGAVVTPEPTTSPTPLPSPTETGAGPIDEESPSAPEDPSDGGDPDGGDPGSAPDTTAPETLITAGPSGTTSSSSATFHFTSNESGSAFDCSVDGGAFAPCTSPYSTGGLGDGNHSFAVRAIDAVGNPDPTPATRFWSTDTTAPETEITNAPGASEPVGRETSIGTALAAPTDSTFEFESSEPGSTFECSLNGAVFASCVTPLTLPVPDGANAFRVRAVDAVGNTDPTPAQWFWSLDTLPPETTITDGPSGTVESTSATFTFTSSESGSDFECSLDGAPFSDCGSPQGYSELSEIGHTFAVRAIDDAGNVDPTPATASWTVDFGEPPDTTITKAPDSVVPATATTAAFEFESSEPDSTFECALDDAAFIPCVSGVEYQDLEEDPHQFQVRAVDPAGNVDPSPATHDWLIGDADAITIRLSWTGPPRDLDLHLQTTGGHVYYGNRCLSGEDGCWAELDTDVTNAGNGFETITIYPDRDGFVPDQPYTVYVVNFACDAAFSDAGASVRILGGTTDRTIPAGASSLKQWNVASISITSAGIASVTTTDTFVGSACGAPRVDDTSASREAAVTPAPTPEVTEFTEGGDPALVANVAGETVRVEWAPVGEAEVRYSTDEFADRDDEGTLACRGDGDCEFDAPADAERLFVTLFRDGAREIEVVEDVTALIVDLDASTDEGSGGGDGEPGEVPPSTPPEDDDPVSTPPDEDDPEADPSPEPEPEPTPDPEPLPSADPPAEGESATA